MHRPLRLHPDCSRYAVFRIDAEAERPQPGTISLRYGVTANPAAIVLPGAASGRADGLWQHTCFEAFIRDGAGYCEFNFAPNGQWAAYRFDGYRAGMRPLDIAAPEIAFEAEEEGFAVTVNLALPFLAGAAVWRMGLTAVIEEAAGFSYWALLHPPGKPDFHHADAFTLDLETTP